MHAVDEFARFKADGRKISIVTAYDAWSARLVARSNVDAILVGDSAAMVMHGHETTLAATRRPDGHAHARGGTRGRRKVRDRRPAVPVVPQGSARGDDCRRRCSSRSGAHAVKLEGVDGHEDVIRHIVGSGVPVMGHLGLTPQSVNQLGGFRVQGRTDVDAAKLLGQAHELEDLGCFSIVLECVPAALAARITSELAIPTIGIGAGAGTDGQVLVLQDLWGVDSETVAEVRAPVRRRRTRADRCAQPVRRRRQGHAVSRAGGELLVTTVFRTPVGVARRASFADARRAHARLRADDGRAARGPSVAGAAQPGRERSHARQHLRQPDAVRRPGRPRAVPANARRRPGDAATARRRLRARSGAGRDLYPDGYRYRVTETRRSRRSWKARTGPGTSTAC